MGTTDTLERQSIATEGAHDRAPSVLIVGTAAALAAVLSVLAMSNDPAAVWDQEQLLRSSWSGPRWPSPLWGPASQALVATLKLFVPAEVLNLAVRAAAAGILYVAVAALAVRTLRSTWHAVVVVGLLATSPVPTTWLSSEVVTAAAIVGVLLAARTRHGWLVGIACATVAAAKPDAVLVGVTLAVWFAWARRDWTVPAGFAGVLLLLVPGTVWVDGYWTYKGGDRSWVAFGQHFASTIGVARMPAGPDPWIGWESYTSRLLPGAGSIVDVVHHYPALYWEFLLASLRKTLSNGWAAMGPLVAVIFAVPRWWRSLGTVGRGAVVALVGVVPNVVFAYPSVRHFARWYPVAAVGALWLLERTDGRRRTAVVAVIVGALAWNILGWVR